MKSLKCATLIAVFALGYQLGSPSLPSHQSSTPEPPVAGDKIRADSSKIEDSPFQSGLNALADSENIYSLAQLGTAFEKLSSAEIEQLANTVERLTAGQRETLLARLMEEWTKRYPHEATQWMIGRLDVVPKPPFGPPFPSNGPALAWAINAPEAAVDYATRCPASMYFLLYAIADHLEPDRVLALVHRLPADSAQARLGEFLFGKWASADYRSAWQAASALAPGTLRNKAVSKVLIAWSAEEPVEALNQALSLNITDPDVLIEMLHEGAHQGKEVAAWLDSFDQSPASLISHRFAAYWASKDPASAFAWAESKGLSLTSGTAKPTFNTVDESPLAAAAQSQPHTTWKWIQSLPDQNSRVNYTLILARNTHDPVLLKSIALTLSGENALEVTRLAGDAMATKNRSEAAAWASTLSGETRFAAWRGIGSFWQATLDDFNLPPGPDRDAFLLGLDQRLHSGGDTVSALNRFNEVSDPALRRKAITNVLWEASMYSDSDKSKASAWVESAIDIPAEWKREWKQALDL